MKLDPEVKSKLISLKLKGKTLKSKARLKSIELNEKFRKSTIVSGNSICTCGSGKKFKFCCRTRVKNSFKSGVCYSAYHKDLSETLYLLGINYKKNKACCAGFPPTIIYLSSLTDFKEIAVISETELKHREKLFGTDWD